MKLIQYMAAGLCALAFSACDDYLNCENENKLMADSYLSTETDLKLYCNGFLQSCLPSYETIAYGDQYADFCATRNSTNFLIGDSWTSADQSGWDFSKLRQANYFLDNIYKAKDAVSEEVYNHYEGVGRFWRAYFYYSMVRTFGDVPWYDHALGTDETEELYKGRDSRELVMEKVLEDLNFASTYCSTASEFTKSGTQVNRYVALAFKSRVCLFEGTYRKYHTELGLQSSADTFLHEAVKAAEELMNNSPFTLVNNPVDVHTQYRALFNSEDLNLDEVIWGIAFQKDVRMHNLTWYIFSGSAGSCWSVVRPFVNMYLMRDGSRFTDREGYESMTYEEEFENRDCRLAQTVIGPDYQRKINGVLKADAPDLTITSTGYHMMKWVIDDDSYVGKATSYNSIPIFRYAEALLNYAEAKAELGEMNKEAWNKSIRLLRERAGVDGSIPADYDPYVAEYFDNQTTDKWILEVRRERGAELAFENVRYDDMMRWKLGHLIERTWQGIYVPAKNEIYDLNSDGTPDVSFVDATPADADKVKGVKYIVLDGKNYRLSEGDHGNLEYGFSLGRQWLDKKYLRPLPLTATQINPALLPQNPGWE